MKYFNDITELTGKTPLLRLNSIERNNGVKAEIYAKVESFNPAGSIKDRVACNMIDDAVRKGRLAPGGTIIEPTSGNTGVGIAMAAAARGYRAVIVMPENMSVERIKLMKAFGAELHLTDASEGMAGCIKKAEQLSREIEGSIIAGQFGNPANPEAHYLTTGPEIWEDTEGEVDIFIATFGTGGTVSGTGRYLKEKDPGIQVIGIEPAESPLLTEGKAGSHMIQGIGANFVPEVLDRDAVDRFDTVKGDDAFSMMKELAETEGVLTGISSGAALAAAVREGRKEENAGKKIVVILPDTGERYLSIY